MRNKAICHPDRIVHGNGLCGSCYQREWLTNNLDAANKRHQRYKAHIRSGGAARANWRYRLKKRFGVSEAEYNKQVVEQGGGCAICGRPPEMQKAKKKLSVDHDHRTNRKRGLLCDTCNRALGLFQDDIIVLKSAIAYLRKYNTTESERK